MHTTKSNKGPEEQDKELLHYTKSQSGLHKSCVNRCAISFERSMANLQRNILQVRMEVLRIPSNVFADTQQCFCVKSAMIPRKVHVSLQAAAQKFTENLRVKSV